MSRWEKFKGGDGLDDLKGKIIFRRTYKTREYLEFSEWVKTLPIDDYDEIGPEDLEEIFDKPITLFAKFAPMSDYRQIALIVFRMMGYEQSEVRELLKKPNKKRNFK